MKIKILLVTIILLPMLSFAQTQLAISADIRGRDCNGGLGLCSLNPIEKTSDSSVLAQKISNTTILFLFDISSMTEQNQISLVGKELAKVSSNDQLFFTQETTVEIDPNTLYDLGFSSNYTVIKPGKYPMIIEKDKVLVTFTLSEK